MKLELISIIVSNAILMLSAVWRISGKLTQIVQEVKYLNEKIEIHKDTVDLRLANLETRVGELERNNWKRS